MLKQKLRGAAVVDVGANNGIYSYWMSKMVGQEGRVFAFEPQPECVRHLDKVKKCFRLNNLEVFPRALSSEKGEGLLVRDRPQSGKASMEFFSQKEDYEQLKIRITTLDDFFSGQSKGPKFIKCDVEGHEMSVFLGGLKTLKQFHPALLFESHHKQAVEGEIFRFLKDLNYTGIFFENGEVYSVSDFAEVPYRKPSMFHRNYMFHSKG